MCYYLFYKEYICNFMCAVFFSRQVEKKDWKQNLPKMLLILSDGIQVIISFFFVFCYFFKFSKRKKYWNIYFHYHSMYLSSWEPFLLFPMYLLFFRLLQVLVYTERFLRANLSLSSYESYYPLELTLSLLSSIILL